MDYPITGCGRPACRTCHPYLVPDEPERDSLPKLAAGVVGLLLVAVALFLILPASAF
jgi:hypothetical protein